MPKPPVNRWNAVSILCTGASCAAAQALKGRRFLSGSTPRLPLADCTSPAACPCTYRKHPDRRAGPRRESEASGIRSSSPVKPDRRAGRGRRSTDQ
ncbi:MAG TPA: hypothetical protein VEH00_12930 [Steroidobacteraceae bacterium]|nr:hypothetical protein [Steroidobacteraceae bacterium]